MIQTTPARPIHAVASQLSGIAAAEAELRRYLYAARRADKIDALTELAGDHARSRRSGL